MKKILILSAMLLLLQYSNYSQQTRQIWNEDFDGTIPAANWAADPHSNAWISNPVLYQPGSSIAAPQSCLGLVPNWVNDSITLETEVYDLTSYRYVYLRFSHICKIASSDVARIEYREDVGAGVMGNWKVLPADAYIGSGNYSNASSFNAASYSDWRAINDTILPEQSWWKEEQFDLTANAAYGKIQLRFVLKHGNIAGTQASFGWLLDNFELEATNYKITPPMLEFAAPYVHGAIYSVEVKVNVTVKSTTNAIIQTPRLYYTATRNNVLVKSDSVLMTNVDGDLWTATLPQYVTGTKISYSVTATDAIGNSKTIYSECTITMPPVVPERYVIIGTGTESNNYTPHSQSFFWSRELYLASEIDSLSRGGLITRLAWYYNHNGYGYNPPVRCYFKAVDDTVIIDTRNLDPLTDGATLVYNALYAVSAGIGWKEIGLTYPFVLPPGKNLLIYWFNDQTASASPHNWIHTATPVNRSIYGTRTLTTGTLRKEIPNARFYIASPVNNAAIPLLLNTNGAPAIPGIPAPVVLAFRNNGVSPLTGAVITCVINGDTTYRTWSGNLPWGFKTVDTLGYFTPKAGEYDTITVWIDTVNGVANPALYSDTLVYLSYECGSGPISYTVEKGTFIPTISKALDLLRYSCTPSGDVTLWVSNGVYEENIDFTDINLSHNVIIRPLSGNRDSVIIRPKISSPAANTLYLDNSYNIVFKNITIDGTNNGAVPVINLYGACGTIVFDSCVIKANNSNNCIEKSYTKEVNGLTVKNCLIDGGLMGVRMDVSSVVLVNQFLRDICIDSNTFLNQGDYAIYFHDVYPSSISYNTITPRSSNPKGNWTAIYSEQGFSMPGGCRIFGNRIYANNSGIYNALKGMHFISTDTVLVANNEIHLNTSATTTYGIHVNQSNVIDFFHNTVLLTGEGRTLSSAAFVAFQWDGISAAYKGSLKNNVLLNLGHGSNSRFAIRLSANPSGFLANYALDYNTYYSTGTNFGAIQATLFNEIGDWQAVMSNDIHSIYRLPLFADSTNSLKIANYAGMNCPVLPQVPADREKKERIIFTSMGAYDGLEHFANDLMLVEILDVQNGLVNGQSSNARVVVLNTGLDTIKSVQLQWFIDDVSTGILTPAISLACGQYDTLSFGPVPYTAGMHTLKVQIDAVNGVEDEQHANDTLRVSNVVCSGAISNTSLQIGSSSTYKTISDVLLAMEHCGISGKVILQLEDGIYRESVDFSGIQATDGDTIELMSPSGNAVIQTDKFGIKSGGLNNVTLKNITVNLSGRGYGILLGTGNNIEVNNCRIHLDTTIAKVMPSSASQEHIGIYRPEGTPSHHGRILNNTVIGGYMGVAIGAGNINTHGTHWILDDNIIQKGYWQNIYVAYTDFSSMSGNYSLAMETDTFANTNWGGFTVQYCNVEKIQGNRIHGQKRKLDNPSGMFLYYLNTDADPAAIYNNEILLSKKGASANDNAFSFQYSSGKIYHNSIYVSETVISNYSLLYLNTDKQTDVRNNNVITTLSVPVNVSSDTVTLDYNNYYTGGIVKGRYMGTPAYTDIAEWKSLSGQDAHSVSVFPKFADLSQSMEAIDSCLYIACPVLPAVPTDINNTSRQYSITAMGAYEQIPTSQLSVVHVIRDFPREAVTNQQIPIVVEVTNFSTITVDSVLFAWSFNNDTPLTYLWKPASSLLTLSGDTITLDWVRATTDTSVQVWIVNVNGIANSLNDTVSAAFKVMPLMEFVESFVADTLYQREFNVNVKIRDVTGSLASTPKMLIHTTVNKTYSLYDTITMTQQNGDIWIAAIPPQYYNSKLVYSLTLSDTIGNTLTIADSTCLLFGFTNDVAIIGTGVTASTRNPYNYNFNYSYSRNYYMSYEIDPNSEGGHITSIAFYNMSTSNSNVDRVSFYLKAVTDSIQTTSAYINPFADGATLVWGQATASTNGATGWMTFHLNEPFYLPANRNLLVYCNNEDGSYLNNNSANFRYTMQNKNTSVYGCYNTTVSSPTATVGIDALRPNIRLERLVSSKPYAGHNLALSLVPLVNEGSLCELSYSPIAVTLTNQGEYDYDFSKDSITIGYEIVDPQMALYKGYVSMTSGGLPARNKNTLDILLTNIPIISGTTTIKIWLHSPVDNIPYDDTIHTTHSSLKISLPMDEDFDGSTMPDEFKSIPDDANGWMPYQPDASFAIQQPKSGTGMLRYAGPTASIAKLTTSRQIDLYGAVNPRMEFWYYHDTATSKMDNSYTDVYIIADGDTARVLQLLKRNNLHGWQQYIIPLQSYTTAQCVLIEFESMNKSSQTVQYIDHIQITSEPDAAVSEIIITPEPALCNQSSSDISVVIRVPRAQAISFANTDSLKLDIDGTIYTVSLQGKTLAGNSSETIPVLSNFTIPLGTTLMKAYYSTPVDNMPANDTIQRMIDIRPNFNIRIHAISQPGKPATAEFENDQRITITNTGNTDIQGIGLMLTIDTVEGKPAYFTTAMMFTQNLSPGDSNNNVIFTDAFTVPWNSDYIVKVRGYLLCDSTILDRTVSIQEYVDMTDLFMVSIEKPIDDGAIDAVNSTKEVTIRLKNRSIAKIYNLGEAKVGILITDTNGFPIDVPILEGLPSIGGEQEVTYTFNAGYRVPYRSKYRLNVYIEKIDEYTNNDTLKMIRETDYNLSISERVGASFTLEQNIPNPAKDKTIINYSIPQDGEILFQVRSVSGQILYNKVKDVPLGEHQIELNLSAYASGIYFYTMEYKGHRIVKRMSVK